MGQAGSTQQQQQENQAGGAAANEQQRRTPGRTGLHYSRSQRNNNGKDGTTLSRFTSRDGENNNKKDAVSPTKPRRKSLDMPDMGLSMTSGAGGGGGTGTPNSIQGTPTQLRTAIFPASRQNSSSMSTPTGSAQQSPKMSLRIQPGGGVEGNNSNSNGAEDGLPMAFAPMQQSHHAEPGTSSNHSITSPTLSAAAIMSPAGRWARHKDGIKEGFGKKAQPVIGEAAVLHAAGLSAEKASQNNNAPSLSTSPTVPQIPLSGSSMSSRASPSSSSSRARLGNMDTNQPSSSSTRRFEAGDNNSLLSPLLPDDIHREPPSAPGHALDPAQLASLLAPTHQKQHQQSQLRQSHEALPDHAHFQETSSPTSSNTTVQQQQQHNNHLRISTQQQQQQQQFDSQPSTPGAGGVGTYSIPVPIPSPLKQPTETILAPELPADVPIVVPSYLPPDLSHAIITDSIGYPLPAMGSNASRTAQDVVSASSSNTAAGDSVSSPLIPGSTPPLGNPPNTLPAAAPIAALNPTLSQDPKAQEAVKAATVDLGAGPDGVATLLTWKAEEETTGSSGLDGTGALKTKIPSQVFVTGTFAKGWSTKIELRRNHDDPKHDKDFTALVKLPPGPHSLKFIVDKQWKTSKYLPSATDADGNLVNYLQVHKVDSIPRGPGADDISGTDDEGDEEQWTQEIPAVLLAYSEATEAVQDAQEEAREAALDAERQHNSTTGGGGGTRPASSMPVTGLPQLDQSHHSYGGNGPSSIPASFPDAAMMALHRKPLSSLSQIQPPTLPAQLEKGVLNATVLVARGSGDDNSILPKPDHSVLNHLAASPIKGGLLSVGVTTRYRRKYVTTVYYKKPPAF